MVTTLALFALFSIGSAAAEVGCAADVTHCTNTDGTLIGTCYLKPGQTAQWDCKIDNKCRASDTPGDYCGTATLKGKCIDTNKQCASVAVACQGQNANVYCRDTANFIGKCTAASADHCELFKCGGSDTTETDCGAGELRGKCTGNTGDCKYSEFVKVKFAIQTKEGAASTFVDVVQTAQYEAKFQTALGTPVSDVASNCPESETPTGGASRTILATVTCTGVPGQACQAKTCTEGSHFLPKDFTKTCTHAGKWAGEYGACAPACPITNANTVVAEHGEYRITQSNVQPDNGTIVCSDPFVGAKCRVVCKDGVHRVTVQTNHTCHGTTPAWGKGTAGSLIKGACQPSVDVLASAKVVLEYAADHEDITSLKNTAFNDNFKKAVLAGLPAGVMAENVIIKMIKLVSGPGSSRRLNEKSVQVDYTIRKGDPENDDPLAGGGLRGTR